MRESCSTERQATYDHIIRRILIACWITEATDTHWEYVILIAFPLQQWLHERAWILCYTYTVYLDLFFHELAHCLVRINLELFPRTSKPGKGKPKKVETSYNMSKHWRTAFFLTNLLTTSLHLFPTPLLFSRLPVYLSIILSDFHLRCFQS